MKNKQLNRCERVMNFINGHWPQIKSFLPSKLHSFDLGFGYGTGMCTNPGLIDTRMTRSNGYKSFVEADLPEGFHCLRVKNCGGSAYFFMM